MRTPEVAVLRDERDLVWLVIGAIEPLGSGLRFDVPVMSQTTRRSRS